MAMKLPTLAEIDIELGRRALLCFTTYTMPNYAVNWHHRVICDHLDAFVARRIKRLMILAPPRTGKSELVSRRLPAYILGINPNATIIAASYGAELARRMNRDVQRIIDDERYQVLFPDTSLSGKNVRSDAQGSWLRNSDMFEVVGHGGYYRGAGVGGAVTGLGMHYGIIDDPIKNRKEANSATYRQSVWEWYTSTFYTRLAPGGNILLIVTRWHEDDLAGKVLKDAQEAKARGEPYDDWEVIEFKAIATEDDEHRKEGEPLWPTKFPLSQLLTIKSTIGSFEFSALYQQTPVDEENRKFKQTWFRYRPYEEVQSLQTYNIMTIDPRGKDDVKTGTDFIGITVNFVDPDNNWNFMSERVKLGATQLIDLMFTNQSRYRLHKIGIEDNQFTQGLMVSIRNEMKLRGVYLNIELMKHGGQQKELRIETLVPRYENGQIFHLTHGGQNQCIDLEEELRFFPKAANDDASDSAAYQNFIEGRPAAVKAYKPTTMLRAKYGQGTQ